MRLNKFIRTFPLMIALLPCFTHAQNSSSPAKQSSESCEKRWMINIDKTSDEVTFRDFGQKYCDCAVGQPLNSSTRATTTNSICMSRTALYLTMDNIGADEGLSNLTEDKIKSSCNDIWAIVNTNSDAANKQENSKICVCAAPKLNALAKDKENYTDREWYAKINEIAAGC